MLKKAGNLFEEILKTPQTQKVLLLYRIKEAWPNIVGNRLAQTSQPDTIKNSTLFVTTTSPCWSQEIMLKQNTILHELSKRHPNLKLQSIRCINKRFVSPKRMASSQANTYSPSTLIISPQRQKIIAHIAAQLKDPNLAEKVKKTMEKWELRKLWALKKGLQPCRKCCRLQKHTICSNCRRKREEIRNSKILRALARRPWLDYENMCLLFPHLQKTEYHQARKTLWNIWENDLKRSLKTLPPGSTWPPQLRSLALDICMLATHIRGDQLEPKHIIYTLGKHLGKAYLDDLIPAPQRHYKPQER